MQDFINESLQITYTKNYVWYFFITSTCQKSELEVLKIHFKIFLFS